MKDMTSLHLKVQDLVSCYAQTDPLREMSAVQKDSDKEEAALKWVALAILHGINSGATQISISRGADGAVKVVAEYDDAELPSPGKVIGKKAIAACVRSRTSRERRVSCPWPWASGTAASS